MIIIILVVCAITIVGVTIYNSIVMLQYRVHEGWSNIDVQLKRRFDLINRLVEVVKGYASYERTLQEQLVELRGRAENYSTIQEKSAAENDVTRAARSLFAVAENYPDLKANEAFLELQKNISEIEDQLQFARRYYNGAVRDYNVRIATFPSNIIASLLHYSAEEFFEIELSEKKAEIDNGLGDKK